MSSQQQRQPSLNRGALVEPASDAQVNTLVRICERMGKAEARGAIALFLAMERAFSPAQRGLIYGKLAAGYPEAQRRHQDPIGKLVAWVAKLESVPVEVAVQCVAAAPPQGASAGAASAPFKDDCERALAGQLPANSWTDAESLDVGAP
jgi:hypothetical protein